MAMIILLVLLASSALASDEAGKSEGPAALLGIVNGDSITSADLDRLLIETHRQMDKDKRTSFDYRKLFDRLLNDRLLAQEAMQLGLDEDEALLGELREKRDQDVMRLYLKKHFVVPQAVDDAAVRAFFEKYYWRIKVRQLSVRTEEEALALIEEIRGGVPMDSLVRERSLDPMKYRDGLHDKYWADLENRLRDASRDLAVGELSAPFPYRESSSFVRLEERSPVDDAAYPEFEPGIRAELIADAGKQAWRAFIDSLYPYVPVEIDRMAFDAIMADSSVFPRAEFMEGSDRVVIRVGENRQVTEAALRKEIVHTVMGGFTEELVLVLEQTVRKKTDELLLLEMAEREGLGDHPDVVRRYEKNFEDALVQAFLNETIAPRIVFNREEFAEFYEENKERFKKEEEVRLNTLMIEEEALAKETAQRLADGADFGYVKKQRMGQDVLVDDSDWAPLRVFSGEIVKAVQRLEIGGSTPAINVAEHWVIFHLKDRRPGGYQTIQEVDGQIREVMFQRKFKELLDDHLGKLKERSEIRLFEANLDEYFGDQE